ncbi:MAG TPA: hypothetical protein VFO65_08525, partial [Acidimicrobiales bacterium]|nr:hypothetical protein [Acidimicrobiales bacterium]
IGSAAVSATLVFGLDGPPELMVLSLTRAPLELARRIHGADPAPRLDLDTAVLAAGAAGWTAVSAAVAVLRYRRLRVTR